MEINQLHYFTVVAKTGSITKAATELYLTQSALSRSIAKLEAELGTNLFDRDSGRLTLNDMGQSFLQYAEDALNTINAGVQYVKSQQANRVIRLADYGATSYLSNIADQCQAHFPTINIETYNYEYLSIHTNQTAPEPDIILTPDKAVEGYIETLAYKEKWCVIFNKQYRFSSDYHDGAISVAQLAKEPITFFGTQRDQDFLFQTLQGCGTITPVSEMRDTAHAINRCQAVGMIPFANIPYLVNGRNNIPIIAVPVSDQCCERYMHLHRHKRFLTNSDDYAILNTITHYIEEMVAETDQQLSTWMEQFV